MYTSLRTTHHSHKAFSNNQKRSQRLTFTEQNGTPSRQRFQTRCQNSCPNRSQKQSRRAAQRRPTDSSKSRWNGSAALQIHDGLCERASEFPRLYWGELWEKGSLSAFFWGVQDVSEGGASEKNGGECEVVWWWRWRGLRDFVNWLFSDFHGGIFKFSALRVLGIFRKMCIDLWGVAGMMLSQSTWCVHRIICFINLRNTLSGMSYDTELLRSYQM